ncbi:hypothetical protein DFH28DRAFT_1110918 [Melampsora americana]|nr:hypothetical protein DFH28DRAFT_1110918 [Melampsora americana]
MTQAPQSRSRFAMGSVLQSLTSKSKSQKLSVSNAITHHTAPNGQVAPHTMESNPIHVDPHFNRNILKRYNAQCSTKTPFREPSVNRNFSQRIIALDAEDDSDDGWPLARFPRARTLPNRVKKSSPPQCRQFVGKAASTAQLTGSEWLPGRGLALEFCAHSVNCGTKEEGELPLESRDQSQLTPPRAINQNSHLVTPGLTLSVSTPSTLEDLPTPKRVIPPSSFHLSVTRVTGLRVRFEAPRSMEDNTFLLPAWMAPPKSPEQSNAGLALKETGSMGSERCGRTGLWHGEDWDMADDGSMSDNESLIDPFIHRR